MTTPPAQCPICLGHGPSTREDVVPVWVRRKLLAMLSPASEPPPRYVAKICTSCNERLSQVFENRAPAVITPLIEGRSVTLRRAEQAFVAGWIAKFALLRAVARRPRKGEVPLDEETQERCRHYLLATLDRGHPPAFFSIRIGLAMMVPSDDSPPDPNDRPLVPSMSDWPWRLPPAGDLGVTWLSSLGFVCWEVVYGGMDLLPFMDATDRDSRMVRIWPPSRAPEVAEWPAETLVTWQEYRSMLDAWDHPASALHVDRGLLDLAPDRE